MARSLPANTQARSAATPSRARSNSSATARPNRATGKPNARKNSPSERLPAPFPALAGRGQLLSRPLLSIRQRTFAAPPRHSICTLLTPSLANHRPGQFLSSNAVKPGRPHQDGVDRCPALQGGRPMSFLRPLRFAWVSLRLSGVPQWPAEHVARLQRRRLRRLVRHAVKHSPFYGEKYRGVKLQDVDLEDLPPTNKTELMANFDRLVTNPAVRRKDLEQFIHGPENLGKYFIGRYAVSHTSGSQGQPMLIVQEPRHLELLFALQMTRGNAAMAGPVRETLRRWFRPARLAAVSMRPGFYPSAASFAYMPH